MVEKKPILSPIILSAILTIVAIVLLTVCGELDAGFKGWFTQTFSHHWIGKSIISTLVFLLSVPVFYVLNLKKISSVSLVWLLVAVTNLSFGVLLAFFFIESLF